MRAFFWSLRREVWENRSVYIAPLIVSVVIVLGSVVAAIVVATRHANVPPDKLAEHYEIAALALMVTTLIVAIFYCLDALYDERRDRSVLFWKSMPVSDWTVVLSKMTIPVVILPVVTFVFTFVTQLLMLLIGLASLTMRGQSTAALLALPWLEMWSGVFHHLVTVHGFYYAPVFGWLLLVSAWAKRLPFLWAFVPLAAIGIIEKMVFNTAYFGRMLGSRLSGGMEGDPGKEGLMLLWPAHSMAFLTMPGLWTGLLVAALCVAGAVRLRRYRSPI